MMQFIFLLSVIIGGVYGYRRYTRPIVIDYKYGAFHWIDIAYIMFFYISLSVIGEMDMVQGINSGILSEPNNNIEYCIKIFLDAGICIPIVVRVGTLLFTKLVGFFDLYLDKNYDNRTIKIIFCFYITLNCVVLFIKTYLNGGFGGQ